MFSQGWRRISALQAVSLLQEHSRALPGEVRLADMEESILEAALLASRPDAVVEAFVRLAALYLVSAVRVPLPAPRALLPVLL
jgi:hypothetical protein